MKSAVRESAVSVKERLDRGTCNVNVYRLLYVLIRHGVIYHI